MQFCEANQISLRKLFSQLTGETRNSRGCPEMRLQRWQWQLAIFLCALALLFSIKNIRHFSGEISRSPCVFSFSHRFMPPLILFHFRLQTHSAPFESNHSGHRSGRVSRKLHPQSPIRTRQVTWVGKATCSRPFVILDCFFFKFLKL